MKSYCLYDVQWLQFVLNKNYSKINFQTMAIIDIELRLYVVHEDR